MIVLFNLSQTMTKNLPQNSLKSLFGATLDPELTGWDIKALSYIHLKLHESGGDPVPFSPKKVAPLLGASHQTVAGSLRTLEKKGFIVRADGPRTGRYPLPMIVRAI